MTLFKKFGSRVVVIKVSGRRTHISVGPENDINSSNHILFQKLSCELRRVNLSHFYVVEDNVNIKKECHDDPKNFVSRNTVYIIVK